MTQILRCGAETSDGGRCNRPLAITVSPSIDAFYECDRGHRIGKVLDVEDYLMATVLGAIGRPEVRQRVGAVIGNATPGPQMRREFAAWWDDAQPKQRNAAMAAVINHVLVSAPSALDESEPLPVMAVRWKR